MGENIRIATHVAALITVVAFSACKKPQLRSEKTGDAEAGPLTAEEPGDKYQDIRKNAIGQKFATLTLGARQFTDAEVHDITDLHIVIDHAGDRAKVSWDEVPDEVREKWGYNPGAKSLLSKITDMLPSKEEPVVVEAKPEDAPEPILPEEPQIDLQKLSQEISRKEKMLESQLAGIRNIESDLARHSQSLAELRNQLASLKAQQSRTRSGGIFVERINGQSKRVDRSQEAAEVESKMKAEEQLVAQFTNSLRAAQRQYQVIQKELNQLRSQY